MQKSARDSVVYKVHAQSLMISMSGTACQFVLGNSRRTIKSREDLKHTRGVHASTNSVLRVFAGQH